MPDCSVIIPVGPGHEALSRAATASVELAWRAGRLRTWTNYEIVTIDDTKGLLGRSKARNEGVKRAKGAWLFFLDADDLMAPSAFRALNGAYDAQWGGIYELVNGCMLERYQLPDITTREQLLATDPYLTLQMGHWVKREIAAANPFDESMDCGEDWKYYLALWRKYRCIKLATPLMINRRGQHSQGPRAATGKQWRSVVERLIDEERARG